MCVPFTIDISYSSTNLMLITFHRAAKEKAATKKKSKVQQAQKVSIYMHVYIFVIGVVLILSKLE